MPLSKFVNNIFENWFPAKPNLTSHILNGGIISLYISTLFQSYVTFVLCINVKIIII